MTLLSSARIHTGRMLNLDLDTVRFPDGSEGTLEMVRHPGAAAVVPFLDDPAATPDPRIVLIRQFRHAADGYIWEIPAGKLDAGEREAPERCAHRELIEETGYAAGRLERLTTIWTTPGFTDEIIHLYAAHELAPAPGGHARESDEYMEMHETRWSEAMAMVRRGDLRDGKTLVALLFVQGLIVRS
jgi:ADP-ribose pyrophosphatase